jgi:hypothetical protein
MQLKMWKTTYPSQSCKIFQVVGDMDVRFFQNDIVCCLIYISSCADDFLRPASRYTEDKGRQTFMLQIDIEYGNLNIADLTSLCKSYTCSGGDKDGSACTGLNDFSTCVGGGVCLYDMCKPCNPCNVSGVPFSYIQFSYRKSSAGLLVAGKHTLVAEGSFLAMLALLLNLKYKSLPNQNTLRLKSPWLNQALSTAQPFETATYRISQKQETGTFTMVGNLTTIIRISAVNDPPVLVNPLRRYKKPDICSSDVNFALKPLECFFGPYWVREDTAEILQIPDFAVTDIDLTEDDSAAQLDTMIFCYKGIVDLNTRTDLNFYDQVPSLPFPCRSLPFTCSCKRRYSNGPMVNMLSHADESVYVCVGARFRRYLPICREFAASADIFHQCNSNSNARG